MSAGLYRIPSRYIAQLVDYLELTGVARADLLRAARIRTLDDPRGQLTVRQTEALIDAAERLSGRQDLGFELGKLVKLTSHDILGYALLTSGTLAQVFRLLSNYQRLIEPFFTLRVHRRPGSVDLVYTPAVAVSHRSMRSFQEAIAVSNHFEIFALLQGRLPPYDIHFSIEPPPHAARYRELAPARIHFGDAMPGLRLTLDAGLLDVPLAMANPRAMRAAEERCKSLLRGTQANRRWSDWCRMMLREAEDCQPTLDQLAGFVNLSSRTMSRYLDAEGASFRDLSLQVRTERARTMLAEGESSVTQIAYRLGYTDVASFARCFRRRTGRTATSFRSSARRRPA
jgi:AraC-like DNA-binding protein